MLTFESQTGLRHLEQIVNTCVHLMTPTHDEGEYFEERAREPQIDTDMNGWEMWCRVLFSRGVFSSLSGNVRKDLFVSTLQNVCFDSMKGYSE